MRIILFLLFPILAFAESQTILCKKGEYQYLTFDTTIVTSYTSKIGDCTFSVRPSKSYDAYRSYNISSTGHFFIFNVFNLNGPVSTSTGARSFYFLPEKQGISLSLVYSKQNKEIKFNLSNGESILFNSETTDIKNISQYEWSEDPVIKHENFGGVEIIQPKSHNSFLVDMGWRLGGDPRILLKGNARLVSNSDYCNLSRGDLVKPIYDQYGIDDFILRYTDTSNLLSILQNCN